MRLYNLEIHYSIFKRQNLTALPLQGEEFHADIYSEL